MRPVPKAADTGRQDDLLAAARAGDSTAFNALVAGYRPQLKAYCYRLLGSVFDAEDAVQDTLVRAWRAIDGYSGSATFRTWLYAIATNVCRTALSGSQKRDRRTAGGHGQLRTPYPGHMFEPEDPSLGPEAVADQLAGIEIAFMVAIQLLPARQRAVLVLREAFGWSAADTAAVLETTVAAVNSALQRARQTLKKQRSRGSLPHDHAPDSTESERNVMQAFSQAWRRGDFRGVAALLAADVTLRVPDRSLRWDGPEAVTDFFRSLRSDGDLSKIPLVATRANGQPAFADYLDSSDGYRPHGIMVVTIDGSKISAIDGFDDPALFAEFGLPPVPGG